MFIRIAALVVICVYVPEDTGHSPAQEGAFTQRLPSAFKSYILWLTTAADQVS